MNRSIISAIALSTLFISGVASKAATVGFESSEGYAPGEIVGQGSPAWTGSTGAAAVVTSGTGQDLQLVKGNVGGVNYTPSVGTFTNTNQYTYSADISLPGNYSDTNYNTEGVLLIGSELTNGTYSNNGTVAIKFSLTGTGIVSFYDGAQPAATAAKAINNFGPSGLNRLLNSTNVLTVSGTINYATSTYTLSAFETGGSATVQETNVAGTSMNIAFSNIGTAAPVAAFGNVIANTQYDPGTASVYRTYAFDNLSVAATPEPASLSACGLVGGMLLTRRRRQG